MKKWIKIPNHEFGLLLVEQCEVIENDYYIGCGFGGDNLFQSKSNKGIGWKVIGRSRVIDNLRCNSGLSFNLNTDIPFVRTTDDNYDYIN